MCSSDLTSKERRIAKTVNFGIIYGMSAFGLAERLGISPSKAKEYIDRYFERYPVVRSYLDSVVENAKSTGYAQSMLGRRRVISELRSPNFQVRSFGERASMNMPLQSSAADIIKLAMIRVDKALENKRSKLILQVHDELIIDADDSELEEIKVLIKREMESAIELCVPLVVDVGSGKSWFDCK